ncbi:MAG: hypothetical protein Q3Y08_05655 [Butyricicoccus sp.]|nr:hypothetical protein [Butyricicoccus sp.]
MSAIKDYRILCCREQWQGGLFCHTVCEGDALSLPLPNHVGVYCLPPIDSGEKGFSWSRLIVDADLPQDSGLRIYVHCADDPDWPAWDALQEAFAADEAHPADLVRSQYGSAVSPGTDCWLTVSGRYLWVALELTATGGSAPTVHALRLRMGGDHMVDYLPAIYRGDDFTLRYLSIYNSMFQDMEDAVEALPRQLDAANTSDEMLECLARWVCLDTGKDDVRERIGTALADYETMYTVEGVKRSVRRLTGREPLIIEHFMVDPNRVDCCNPALYLRLYGDNPYRFFVLLDEDTFASRDQMEWFLTRMQELIPAGSDLELVLLKQCVQLDWHTYLGVNSRVGSYIPAVIDENVTIHYDTTIGGATI